MKKSLEYAMILSSNTIGGGYVAHLLEKREFISKPMAVMIFITIIGVTILLMVIHAYKAKD